MSLNKRNATIASFGLTKIFPGAKPEKIGLTPEGGYDNINITINPQLLDNRVTSLYFLTTKLKCEFAMLPVDAGIMLCFY